MKLGIEALENIRDLTRQLAVILGRLIRRIEVLEERPVTEVTSSSDPGGVPLGATIAWDSEVSLPIGFLRREGQAISRTEYAELFALFGTRYGAGNGSTTFNIPNSKGLVLRHAGTQVVNGRTKDGGTLGSVLEDQMQKIEGQIPGVTGPRSASATGTGAFVDTAFANTSAVGGSSRGVSTFDFDSANSPDARTSSTTAGETRVSSQSTIFIVKAQNLEITSATSSAIDSLNSRVSDLEVVSARPIAFLSGQNSVGAGASALLLPPEGSIGANATTTRVLNTLDGHRFSEIVSLASNTVTFLKSGVYKVTAVMPFYRTQRSDFWFSGTVPNCDRIRQSLWSMNQTSTEANQAILVRYFTITAGETLFLRHFNNANGLAAEVCGQPQWCETGCSVVWATLQIEALD